MSKVVIIQRRMVHYRLELFHKLRERLAENKVELKVIHGQCSVAEEAKLDTGTLSFATVRKNFYSKVFGALLCFLNIKVRDIKGADLLIIPQENSFLINYLILLFRKPLKIKSVAFWGHGKNFQASDGNSRSEKLKEFLLHKVDWWFCYTEMSQKVLVQCGFDEKRITDLQNSIDTNALRDRLEDVTDHMKADFIDKYDLCGKPILLYLGSMYKEKEISFLLKALLEIKRLVPSAVIFWGGSGPDSTIVEKFCRDNEWSHYLGALHGYDKALVLSLSKVIVNPGLVGLGVLDSFVSHKPLISSHCGNHSPEVVYLKTGINGLITEFDKKAYANGVAEVLNSETLYGSLVKGCKESSEKYTVDNMSCNFSRGIMEALKRRTCNDQF